MQRLRVSVLWLAVLLPAAAPEALSAQGRRCNQVLPADARQLVNARGQEMVYFRDPVRMVCTGGLVIEADSAVMNRALSSIQLVGDVLYQDSIRRLTADWANYLGRTDELHARGSVELLDLEQGTTVTGDELQYLRPGPERPVARTVVRGRRPYALLPAGAARADQSAGTSDAGDTVPPLEVWASRLELEGDSLFLGEGAVEFVRGELRGAAQTARFDRGAGRIVLTREAHVQNPQYRLEGERIDALLPGDTLREVRSQGDARLESEDLSVRSQRVRIALEEGAVERVEAWNPESLAAAEAARAAASAAAEAAGAAQDGAPDTAAAALEAPQPDTAAAAGAGRDEVAPPVIRPSTIDLPRALAVAQDFTLRADSIDARADSGQIREVRAISRAFGEREPKGVPATVPAHLAQDWIQGDTIISYFEEQPATDTVTAALERIVVIGGPSPALSLYRMAPESAGDEPGINFMKAQRIILFMTGGEVARVEAQGPIDGLYLEPVARPEEGAAVGASPPEEETTQ